MVTIERGKLRGDLISRLCPLLCCLSIWSLDLPWRGRVAETAPLKQESHWADVCVSVLRSRTRDYPPSQWGAEYLCGRRSRVSVWVCVGAESVCEQHVVCVRFNVYVCARV